LEDGLNGVIENNKVSEIFNFEKLYRAYLSCRKEKRKTINALEFEYNLERNLFALLQDLKTKRYKPGRSICFVATKPVYREIFAAQFRDRVVHHLLVKEILEMGERRFIFNSCACRKEKGTHFGINRLKKAIRIHGHKKLYYLQMDIAGFFMGINHCILYAIFKKFVIKRNKSEQWEKDILWLGKTVIFHKPINNYVKKGDSFLFNLVPKRKSLFNSEVETGLPIGNYSSQFFANLYLDQLDQHVKRELKCNHYFRYVDDFILLSGDKEQLKKWCREIEGFLNFYLKLKINKKKTKIQPAERGIDFLGYFVKPNYVLSRRRIVSNFKEKSYKLKNENICWNKEAEKTAIMINSYFGHLRHANTYSLRKKLLMDLNWKFWGYFKTEDCLLKVVSKNKKIKEEKTTKRKRKNNKKQKSVRAINIILFSLNK
jgi:RNA-directed DNA polymerase